jgi:hypothetical protein
MAEKDCAFDQYNTQVSETTTSQSGDAYCFVAIMQG